MHLMNDVSRRTAIARAVTAALLIIATASSVSPLAAAPAVGTVAPMFTGIDTHGRTVALADYRGSIVVLEWTNHDCPFVRRHYESGNMQSLQERAMGDGVIWLTIISSAPGEQGHVEASQADGLTTSRGAAPTAVLLDPSGEIGRAYAAKTTPHMFVIDPAGTIAYMGAIDNQPRNFASDPATAVNYVQGALDALKAGNLVPVAVTQPYGCSVKYKADR